MYIPFKLGDKEFLLKPYTTAQEKEILLLSSFSVDDFDRIFEILDFKYDGDLNDLSEDEKKVLLYKFRDISVGDEVDIKFVCEHCKASNENKIEATNFVVSNIRDDDFILKKNIPITDETLQEFVPTINVDDLDLQEFEELKQKVKDNQISFNFIKSTKCLKCKTPKIFDMSGKKYIIEILSEDTLMTLYKTYNYMIYFGHYTKTDIDNMMPFERTILTGLLSKTKEDLTK